jgi:uncharacterized protein YyaL (SSP411 family)
MSNRLGREISPYLLQHAENPVDWFPWGEEAWKEASLSGKPVLLSIGYSSCHWCHVMAHESFEDPETARLMNANFVNIKVDREERPDLDHIYQTAHQLLAKRGGGWPLTIFLTSKGVPFAAGTYFPKSGRYGLPGFTEVLSRIHAFYSEHRSELESPENRSVVETLDLLSPKPQDGIHLSRAPIEGFLEHLRQVFDEEDGGFGSAPKFPHSQGLSLLLEVGIPSDREMAIFTLRKMARGGLFDQIGGGFSRYSVDDRWEIPHFEKMLYDNGPLLGLYSQVWARTGDPFFKKVAEETVGWALREMRSPEGLYYSSLDADSEGEEGKFYRWTREEISKVLDPEELRVATKVFGLDRPPNFEHQFWHLVLAKTPEEVADEWGMSVESVTGLVERSRKKLLAFREKRVRPGRDEKILTSWNALYLKGLLQAGEIFGREDWIQEGLAGLEAIRLCLWSNGRLQAVYGQGSARLSAYLDDYSFLLDAILAGISVRFSPEALDWALEIAKVLREQFEDREAGGFFFTAHDHEALIHRIKTGHDQSLPNGNGVVVRSFIRLGTLLGDSSLLGSAERTLLLFASVFNTRPEGYDTLLGGLFDWLSGVPGVVLKGREARNWQRAAREEGLPFWSVVLEDRAAQLPEALMKPWPPGDSTRAYICGISGCLAPVDEDRARFLSTLRELSPTTAQGPGGKNA